jgi:hypothetical protein
MGADLTIRNKKNEVISCLGKKNQHNKYNELENQEQYINDCTHFNEMNQSEIESDIQDNFSDIETPAKPLEHSVLKIFLFDKLNDNNNYHSQNNYKMQNIEQKSQQEILQRELQRQLQLQEQDTSSDQQQHNYQHQRRFHSMHGGKRNDDSELESSSDSESDSSPDSDFRGTRKINNPYLSGGSKKSEKNHNDAIENIKNLGYDELDAKDIKNFLYYEIKENYPDLNND